MTKKILCVALLVLSLVCVLASCTGTPNTPENPTHTHEFGEWETTKDATCTETGEKERYCSCGEKQTNTIPTVQHEFSQKNTSSIYLKTEANYDSPAVYYYSCECGKTGSDTFTHGNPLEKIAGDIPNGVYMAPYTQPIKIDKDNLYIYSFNFYAFLEYSYKYYVEDYEIHFDYQGIKLLNPNESTITEYNELKNTINEDISKAYLWGEKENILLSENAFNLGGSDKYIKLDEKSSAKGDLENGVYTCGGITLKVKGNLVYDYAANNGCQVAMVYKYTVVGTQINLEYQEMILLNVTPETLEDFEAFKDNPYLRFSNTETITISDDGFVIDTEYDDYLFVKLI